MEKERDACGMDQRHERKAGGEDGRKAGIVIKREENIISKGRKEGKHRQT